MPEPPDSTNRPPSRRARRWGKILLGGVLLLAGFVLLIDGPIARLVVARVVRDQLAKQGLHGEMEVEGRLWSGFSLKNGAFEGSGRFQLVRFGELSVRYNLRDLLDKQIESLTGRGFEVVMRLEDGSPEERPKSSPPIPWEEIGRSLREVRPLVIPARLLLEDIRLTVRRAGETPVSANLDALRHESGSSKFHIEGLSTNVIETSPAVGEPEASSPEKTTSTAEVGGVAQDLPGPDQQSKQSFTIDWGEDEISIDRFKALPGIAAEDVELHYGKGEAAKLKATVTAGGARLAIETDQSGRGRVRLEDGPLDLGKLTLPGMPALQGTIETLVADLTGLLDGPDAWRGKFRLSGRDVALEDGRLPELSVRGDLTDKGIEAQSSLGKILEVNANLPRSVLVSLDTRDDRGGAGPWQDLPLSLAVRTPSIHEALKTLWPAVGREVPDLANIPDGNAAIEGTVTTGGAFGVQAADLRWSLGEILYQSHPAPAFEGTVNFADGVARATASLADPQPGQTLDLAVGWDLDSRHYDGELEAELPDPSWLVPFLPGEGPLWRPTGSLALDWSGRGALPPNAPASHEGRLEVGELHLTAPGDTTTSATLEGSYNWPESLAVNSFTLRNGDLRLDGALRWEEGRLTVAPLRLHDQTGLLARLEGRLPADPEALTPEAFFAQEQELGLELEARELRLQRLAKLVPLDLPAGFTATLDADLEIAGTPAAPTLGGEVQAAEITTPGPESLPVLSARLDLSTSNRTLHAHGEVAEPDGQLVTFKASLPLRIRDLVEDPGQIDDLPLTAQAMVRDFNLQRLRIFLPRLAESRGAIEADMRLGGTIGKPALSGGAALRLDYLPLPNLPHGAVEDSRLLVRLDGDRIVIDPSPITAAGGRLILSGAVSLAEEQPQFDLQAIAESVLIWRDDQILIRSNGRLTFTGPWEDMRIRGDLALVESLYHKDIEILPRGIPAGGAERPVLPQFDLGQRNPLEDLPAPFAGWGLDVAIRTDDPLLIRGNIATGRVTATARLTGTLADPRPEGVVNLRDAEAVLPLSKLSVRQGTLTLRPEHPFDPVLDMRGVTVLNRHQINVYLFGPLSNLRYELVSDPPLPQHEILTLLATGATTAGLEDQDTATRKAFQFLINELKRRFRKPGRDTWFQRFLETLEVVEFRIGENDPFSGRSYTSATLQLNRFLSLSAAVDRENHSRALLVFSPQPSDSKALLGKRGSESPSAALSSSKVRIRGLRSISTRQALAAISGRLEFILNRPATPSRASDAAFLLERHLKKLGFSEATVASKIASPTVIHLLVDEGPRYSLGDIVVSGVEEELAKDIREQMRSAHLGPMQRTAGKIPYLPENNDAGLDNVKALLHSRGHWAGQVELASASRDPDTGGTTLRLAVSPGPLFRLASVGIGSPTPFRQELLASLRSVIGRVADTGSINRARSIVESFFRDRGYRNAKVSMQAAHADGRTRLSFGVEVGKRVTVGKVHLAGLRRTNPDVVHSLFEEFPGQFFNREEADDQIRELFATGAFSGIRLEEEPVRSGTIDLTLHFKEAKPTGYQFYAGAGSYEGFILGAAYYHRNLFGNLWNLSARAEFSGLGLLGEVRVTDPWFLGYDLRFTPRAFLLARRYEGYDKLEGGLGAELAWDLTEHYSMTLDWTSSVVSLSANGLSQSEIGPNTYALNVLGLTQTYDRRNDAAVPTDGFIARLSTDLGLALGERNVSFFRAEGLAAYYHPLTTDSFLAFGARAGAIIPGGSSDDLPIDLRFFAGGANSVRSFPERELGPRGSGGDPRGGEAYWIANLEYVRRVAGPVHGVAFLDAGSLSRSYEDLLNADVKFAAGLGVRVHLPIGALRLEYGRGLFTEPGDPAGALHFAIGASF